MVIFKATVMWVFGCFSLRFPFQVSTEIGKKKWTKVVGDVLTFETETSQKKDLFFSLWQPDGAVVDMYGFEGIIFWYPFGEGNKLCI